MSAAILDEFKQVDVEPLKFHDGIPTKEGDKCEIVIINNCSEYKAKIVYRPSKIHGGPADMVSSGPFVNATLMKLQPIANQEDSHRGPLPPNEVLLEDGTKLIQAPLLDCWGLSFYYVVGTPPEKQSKTKVTFSFLKGKCISHSIEQEFAGTQSVNDIKTFIRGTACYPNVGRNIILVWDKNAYKLENDDQLISTLGETANISVNFVKPTSLGAGRKSHRRHKSNKNKRTRRKSVKRLHRRKLY